MAEHPKKRIAILRALKALGSFEAPADAIRQWVADNEKGLKVTDDDVAAAKKELAEAAKKKAGDSAPVPVPRAPAARAAEPPMSGANPTAEQVINAIQQVRALVELFGKDGVKKLVDAI